MPSETVADLDALNPPNMKKNLESTMYILSNILSHWFTKFSIHVPRSESIGLRRQGKTLEE